MQGEDSCTRPKSNFCQIGQSAGGPLETVGLDIEETAVAEMEIGRGMMAVDTLFVAVMSEWRFEMIGLDVADLVAKLWSSEMVIELGIADFAVGKERVEGRWMRKRPIDYQKSYYSVGM